MKLGLGANLPLPIPHALDDTKEARAVDKSPDLQKTMPSIIYFLEARILTYRRDWPFNVYFYAKSLSRQSELNH